MDLSKTMTDFGVIIACCAQDYLFTKGCCESIRYSLGDVPICLIVDGRVDVSDLITTYGVRILTRSSVKNDFLRQASFGWGLTKMIAFFESPWETFLFLDSDTNIWGDVLQYADFSQFDAVIDRHSHVHNEQEVNEFFFNTQLMEEKFPDFPWRDYQDHYFCTGTFFSKRGIFTIEEYKAILALADAYPNLFPYGSEMGFLNFMFCRAAHGGRISLGSVDFQVICADFSRSELQKRFPVGANQQPLIDRTPAAVIHWPGRKPFFRSTQTHSAPMDYCRAQCLLKSKELKGGQATLRLRLEDWQTWAIIYKNKLLRKVGALRRSITKTGIKK
jgi:hypothetical protein